MVMIVVVVMIRVVGVDFLDGGGHLVRDGKHRDASALVGTSGGEGRNPSRWRVRRALEQLENACEHSP